MRNCLVLNTRERWPSLLCAAALACAGVHAQTLETLGRDFHEKPGPATRAALLRYANAHSKEMPGALALLALGAGELEQKQFNDALTHLRAAEKRLPALADYSAYLEAAAEFELRDFGRADKDLKPVWDHAPSSPLIVKAIVLRANAFIQSGEPKKAIELLEKRGSEIAPEQAVLLSATAYGMSGDTARAATEYQRLYSEFPFSKEAEAAQAAIVKYPPASPQARLARCNRLLDGGDYAKAKTELEALTPELSGTDRDAARVLLGADYYLSGDSREAFSYLNSLDVTSGEPGAERLYYVAQSARKLDRTADLDAAVAQLGQLYPSSTWRLQAITAAAGYYAAENRPEQYQPLFRACYESFGSDPRAANCHWRFAWGEYLKDRSKGDLLVEHLKSYPSSPHDGGALYYLGRIAETKGDFAAARAYYDKVSHDFANEYYGMLARDRMKQPAIAGAGASPQTIELIATVKFRAHPVPEMRASAVSEERIGRARLLASAGLDDLAYSELRFGARHDGQPQVLALELARLATQRDSPDQAIRFIKRYAPGYLYLPLDASTEALWRFAFPLPFWKPLTEFARQRGIDPYLLAGLIRQESEFNPKVVSFANAYGLTQVLPSTGRELSRRLNIRPFRANMLFTPEVNLNIGTYYLRMVLDSLEGKYEAALASYNAGKSRVTRWLSWNEFHEPAEFVESIPFTQTREYVQSVLRNADIYRRLYGERPVALGSTQDGDGAKNAASTSRERSPANAISQRAHRKFHRVGDS